MNAGPELDALIAEHVFGWEWIKASDLYDVGLVMRRDLCHSETGKFLAPKGAMGTFKVWAEQGRASWIDSVKPPLYSSHMGDAWDLFEILAEKGYSLTKYSGWCCYRGHYPDGSPWGPPGSPSCAAHAICLAAIEAFNIDASKASEGERNEQEDDDGN